MCKWGGGKEAEKPYSRRSDSFQFKYKFFANKQQSQITEVEYIRAFPQCQALTEQEAKEEDLSCLLFYNTWKKGATVYRRGDDVLGREEGAQGFSPTYIIVGLCRSD